ncbi:MAG: hypothetical protein HZA10_05360 [Nitrospirae bacterium]|nr:hypothetical protein [Nitrospirota bacterium]
MRVFIDTGAFCALAIPKDQHNKTAKAIYEHFRYHPYAHSVKFLIKD